MGTRSKKINPEFLLGYSKTYAVKFFDTYEIGEEDGLCYLEGCVNGYEWVTDERTGKWSRLTTAVDKESVGKLYEEMMLTTVDLCSIRAMRYNSYFEDGVKGRFIKKKVNCND